MKNLKIINITYIRYLIIILLLFSNEILSLENKIIFKINNLAFTSLDYDNRVKYLKFVGTNKSISKKEIINDFISANLFFEYYKKQINKKNYTKEIKQIFENILNSKNDLSNKDIDKENILFNIRIDFIRKIILEDILNSNLDPFKTTLKEIDLLYKFNITYINLDKKDFIDINNNFILANNFSSEEIQKYLINNNIDYFIKENEINNVERIEKKIKDSIISNKKFLVIEKNDNYSLIFIDKSFETLNGILVNLYSIKSNEEIKEKYLSCSYLEKNKDNEMIIQKEYELQKLNDQLKNNLINVNDYVKFKSNNEFVYVFLCNIKFDKEILNNVNLNKLINSNVGEIEKNFISKYSDLYNLVVIYE